MIYCSVINELQKKKIFKKNLYSLIPEVQTNEDIKLSNL
jgi:hypothetical protein